MKITKKDFEYKLYNKRFSEEELENLLWFNFQCIDGELNLQEADEIKESCLDR